MSQATEKKALAHDEIEAIVGKLAGEKKGGYIVAYPYPNSEFRDEEEVSERGGVKTTPITCEMADWAGKHPPRKGQVIILENVEKFHNGWRARRARPVVWDGGEHDPEHN